MAKVWGEGTHIWSNTIERVTRFSQPETQNHTPPPPPVMISQYHFTKMCMHIFPLGYETFTLCRKNIPQNITLVRTGLLVSVGHEKHAYA